MIATVLIVMATCLAPKPEPPSPPVRGVTSEEFARAAPEHKVAMLDARKWVDPGDLRVVKARELLGQVDKLYAEDAARIVEITELFWREILEAKQEATATEILKGSLEWRDPSYFKEGKREFTEFAVLYATLREEGVSHDKALEALKRTGLGKAKEKK